MRVASVIVLSTEVQATLLKWSRSRKVEARLVQRAKIVLLAAQGLQNKDIAQQLKTDPGTVSRWRRRFAAGGLEAIEKKAPVRGRAPSPKLVSKILETTTKAEASGGATHWSTRTLAQALGTSKAPCSASGSSTTFDHIEPKPLRCRTIPSLKKSCVKSLACI